MGSPEGSGVGPPIDEGPSGAVGDGAAGHESPRHETPAAAAAAPTAAVSEALTTVASIRETIEALRPRLAAIRDEWEASLPPGARSWTPGAAYIRESSARSLVGEAAEVQLRQTLALLAQRRIYVAPDAVFVDIQSGTDIAARAAFQRLFEQAIAGGFKAIGVFISERLFRNLEQAIKFKRQFRLKGVELVYLGKYEGDQRNPASWQLEIMQDTSAELHARNTSFHVGTHLESISRAGRPIGPLPEVYRAGPRAPSFLGRRGSVLHWEIVEPLGSMAAEARRRYVAGASFSDLARWSASSELGGVTPAGHQMTEVWWYRLLTNPKLAGYHQPTKYTGYRPGKEAPKRERKRGLEELVPCLLPALWTLDDHKEILRIAHGRSRAYKVRRTFRVSLLSGVAVDATCGHGMQMRHRESRGRYSMQCGLRLPSGKHSPGIRVDMAERELDELMAAVEIDGPEFGRQIEEELHELARAEASDREQFRPDPAIAAVRSAIATLEFGNMTDFRPMLEARLAELERADAVRRDTLAAPVVDFRRAYAQLKEWSEVWRTADVVDKNRLLREVGLKVVVGRLPGSKRTGSAQILSMRAENPAFELALAAVLKGRTSPLGTQQTYSQPYGEILLHLATDFAATAWAHLGADAGDGIVRIPRPFTVDLLAFPPLGREDEPGRWRTLKEAAIETGLSISGLGIRITTGKLTGRKLHHGRRPYWLIADADVERIKAEFGRVEGSGRLHRRHVGPLQGTWHTLPEAALSLGVHATTLQQWITDGRLEATESRIGRQWRWLISDTALERVRLESTAPGWRRREVPADRIPAGTWWTIRQASARLGISHNALLLRIEHGKLRATKVIYGPRGVWFIADDEMERLIGEADEAAA